MILEIEPIPRNQWGLSLAQSLPFLQWNEIRKTTFRAANYICQICGDNDRHSLTCHEIWIFDDTKLTQTLQGFESCCRLCHNVHHFGRSKLIYRPSYVRTLIQHWCEVNELTSSDFEAYEKEIAQVNIRRANNVYSLIVFGKDVGRVDEIFKGDRVK